MFDNYIISWPVLFLALLETGAFSWFYGINRLEKDIKSMIGKDLSYYWKATWLVLTPLIVTVSVEEVTLSRTEFNIYV